MTKWVAITFFVAVYAMALYFQAATASLYDRYQPGIEFLQICLTPSLLLVVSVIASLMYKGKGYREFLKGACLACIAVGFALAAFVFLYEAQSKTWIFPEDRTLMNTLESSLLDPVFSNRSILSVSVNIVFSSLLVGWLFWSDRRGKVNKAVHATSDL